MVIKVNTDSCPKEKNEAAKVLVRKKKIEREKLTDLRIMVLKVGLRCFEDFTSIKAG